MQRARWRRQQRARWLKKGKPMPEWVFPSLEGTALEERNVRHVFTRMLEKAELRRIRLHDLRHTFASLLLQHGESVVYVKEQLGHGSIQITVDTYGHLNLAPIAQRSIASMTTWRRSQTQPRRNQIR
jgi:integrase